MSSVAPTLEAFFADRLARQREASHHTVASYRDTFRLLLGYVHARTGQPPSKLGEVWNVPRIGVAPDHGRCPAHL